MKIGGENILEDGFLIETRASYSAPKVLMLDLVDRKKDREMAL